MQKLVHRALYLSIVHLSLLANIFAIDTSIGVLNIIDRNEDELSAINYKGEPYISVKEISRILSNRKPYENAARQKIVLYFSNNRVKISNLSSFVVVNDKIFQMTKNAFGKEEDIYVPAKSFFSILKNSEEPSTSHGFYFGKQ